MSAPHTPGLEAGSSINGVPWAEFEANFHALHELLCRANLVRMPYAASFNGWTADGRAVRHRFKVEGYERTGPTVEREARRHRGDEA